jgi:uncharacterized protein YunC (DUF1805 family)
MEKHIKDMENIKVDKGFFACNFEVNKCQLLEVEHSEGFSECGA